MTPSRYLNDRNILHNLEPKGPIAWPKMIDERWAILDSAVFSTLHTSSNIFDRIQLLEHTIYSEAANLFGHRQTHPHKNLAGKSRRTKLSISLVKEKNSLIAKINMTVDPQEQSRLGDLLKPIREKIKTLRRSEKHRKKRWLFKKAQTAFKSNPYQAGKNLLDPKLNVALCVSQAVLDNHKEGIVKDTNYNVPLEPLDGLPPDPEVQVPFVCKPFCYDDFEKLLLTRRNKSSPGINGIPYKVYKKCTQISSFLFKIFSSCQKHSLVPLQWRYAMEFFIPKTKPPIPSNIKDFRPIALLIVEGKLFFSLVSKRLEQHIINNNRFIDTSIQKGCMEKVPGCWEHMSLVWSALKDARQRKTSLANIWLDIANAYGSIPHRLIFFALRRYGVPNQWITLIKNYYFGLYTKSFSKTAPSDWHQHFRGIFAGCTISIILFLAGINVIIEYTLTSNAKCFINSSKVSLPLVRAFMDDLNLMSATVSGTQELLSKCTKALTWAGMSFRADKSRSITIVKGKSMNTTPFHVREPSSATDFSCYIPSIQSMPVKFLGRVIDGSLSDRRSIKELQDKVLTGLKIIHKSSFKGNQKLWILHHLLIPKIQWTLLIYEVPISVASLLEKRISFYIRKWLNLHPSTTSISLYSPISPCPLPLKSLTDILKSSKISGHLLLRDSRDPLVSSTDIKLKAGIWQPNTSATIAEAELNFQKIRGPIYKGRSGLGVKKPVPVPPKQSHGYRKMVSSTSKQIDDEQHIQKALELRLQCHWISWENYIQNNLSWRDILALPPNLLSFCISSTYNVLPSPSNLSKHWKVENDSSCSLCGKELCTIPHILGACKFSLDQGRFTFRHDNVLASIVSILQTFLKDLKPAVVNKKVNRVHFIKAGQKPPKINRNPTGILHLASDWVILSDLSKKFVFPCQIALTDLRPDIVLYSKTSKRVILLELTCPCEENMVSWHTKKITKYSGLVHAIRTNKWFVDFFAVEVGARGYPSNSLKSSFRKLGLPNKTINGAVKQLGRISMECSFYIWMHRNSKEWTAGPVSSLEFDKEEDPKSTKVSGNKMQHLPKTSSAGKGNGNSLRHAGFVNKGNTCYINSMLQALSVLPSFWCQESSQSGSISPLGRALSLNMSLLKKRSTPIDPSNFLRAFQNKISKKRGTAFNINSQQDVPEMLHFLIDELKGDSVIADQLISTSVINTTTCNTCFNSSSTEQKFNIICLPLCSSLQSSFNKFLEPELLDGDNKWFCGICSSLKESIRDYKLVNCGSIILLQLNRYAKLGSTYIKDNRLVKCPSDCLTVPISTDNDITISRSFKLRATINHSGTINAGHYWTFIKVTGSNQWLKCNDTSVTKASFKDLTNNTSYIFIYTAE